MRNPSNPFDVFCAVPILNRAFDWIYKHTYCSMLLPWCLHFAADMMMLISPLLCSSPVCISLYETVTGSSEAEMPYHWYTDQRFALFIICLVIILPLSIPKEIGIQKYTRYAAFVCGLIKHLTFMFMIELFPPDFSVLGTLAATYLCVAVIVKYYLMESHMVVITPEHSQGSVTRSLTVSCINYDNLTQDFFLSLR